MEKSRRIANGELEKIGQFFWDAPSVTKLLYLDFDKKFRTFQLTSECNHW